MKTQNIISTLMKADESVSAKQAESETSLQSGLASNKGYLMFVKYAVFLVLAALNLHLFMVTLPGTWGLFIGAVAVLSETEAIYCFNNYSKSEGKHKFWLGFFAVHFTVMSLFHALASIYSLQGGLGADNFLDFYSHKVAFHLIFGSMVASVGLLHLTHWKTKISEKEAQAAVEIASSRAGLLTERAKLNDQLQLQEHQIDFLQRKLIGEEKGIALLEQFGEIARRKQAAFNGFDGSDKDAILHMFGQSGLEPIKAIDENQVGFAPSSKK